MRVLYVNTLYPPYVNGGAELVLKTQAEALAARGHAVTVLTIGPNPGVVAQRDGRVSVLQAQFRNQYFHLSKVSPPIYRKVLWHLKDRDNRDMARVVRRLVPRIDPEVVCCHNLAGWSISVWREVAALGRPIVQVLHDQYLLCAKSTMFRAGRNCANPCIDCRLLRTVHTAASNQVSAVVGVSRFVLERLLAAGLFATVPIREVLYNVSAQGLPPASARRSAADARTIRFGFIGTLTESKGIRPLLDTVSRSKLEHIRLRVAGRGEAGYERELFRAYRDPRIEFLGYVAPRDFFGSIDVSIVPSLWHDTLPSVVFESLGAGVPVIGSRRGGIPEMVVDGVNGLLFEPDQPDALLGSLQRLLQDRELLRELTGNCRPSAARFFDMEARTDAEEAVLGASIRLARLAHAPHASAR